MICRAGHTHTQLVCPTCVMRASRQANLIALKALLPDVVAGRIRLHTAQSAMGHRHLELYGDPDQALCGELLTKKHRRAPAEYSDETIRAICPKCRTALDGLLKEETGPRPIIVAEARNNKGTEVA